MITLKQSKVFLVDDDVFYSHLLKKGLEESHPVDIIRFSNAEDCIYKLKKGSVPDLIFLDYNLDAYDKCCMNGVHALQNIKNLFPKLSTYIISGSDNIEMLAASAKDIGAQGFITKSDFTLKLMKNILDHHYFLKNNSKQNRF